MHPVEALTRLGGTAERSVLLCATTRKKLERAVGRGEVVRLARGRYALPTASRGAQAARRLSGAASHRSAAAGHGWGLAFQPVRPEVVVPRNRNVPPARRFGVELRWRPLSKDEQASAITEPYRTVLDCARDLPFREALVIADSALRDQTVDAEVLEERALLLPRKGRARALTVVESASSLAANPFESMLRALAREVPGLDVSPQVLLLDRGFRGRPDLVDAKRRLVLEADSWEHHASKKGFERDCARYNALTLRGWTVLRFTWHQVMYEPWYVLAALKAAVEGSDGRAVRAPELLWTA